MHRVRLPLTVRIQRCLAFHFVTVQAVIVVSQRPGVSNPRKPARRRAQARTPLTIDIPDPPVSVQVILAVGQLQRKPGATSVNRIQFQVRQLMPHTNTTGTSLSRGRTECKRGSNVSGRYCRDRLTYSVHAVPVI